MILDVMIYLKVLDKLLLTRAEGSLGYGEDQSDNDKATSECIWMGLRSVLRVEKGSVEMIKNDLFANT